MKQNDYSGQFGENEKLIDEANLQASMLELIQDLWNNANSETKRDLSDDYKKIAEQYEAIYGQRI